jgi:probable rRNA maturation factor
MKPMHTKKPLINFILADKRWTKLIPGWKEEISRALEKAGEILEEDFSRKEVSVVLMDDEEVQRLNKTFRHQDKPTNVLSFPSDMEGELGDIILGYETVKKEAAFADIPAPHHALHLIIHGFLHLLGYDHVEEEAACTMEAMEVKILKALNIKNPYEDK